MNASLKKMEMEKNNFIRKLNQTQFDGVITNKYKKVFIDYFDGLIDESELAKKVESNMELISIYENGDTGKIDPNQYLYSAIVDVALNYFNVANGFETCLNKLNLIASYFQLVASVNVQLEFLNALIYDVFYVNANFTGKHVDTFMEHKLDQIKNVANSLDEMFLEISKHEDVIDEVEKTSKNGFMDESHIDDDIKEMYVNFKELSETSKDGFKSLVDDCVDESNGAKLNILNGTLK